MSTKQKLLKVLAIVVAALQIPLLMLWNITIDAFRTSASEIKFTEGGYDLVFQWDKVGNAILSYFPILLALAVCLVMTVLGLIFILRQKRATLPTVCFYAITVFSCGFLYLAFAAPAIIVGEANAPTLMLSEFIFFRYFGGMELRIVSCYLVQYFVYALRVSDKTIEAQDAYAQDGAQYVYGCSFHKDILDYLS